ncbi:MAG: hypothetical protein JO027_00125 [Solirubrobacterales bacterium]|nr:hypothetical protein [Solirubrobacterales bacterium]
MISFLASLRSPRRLLPLGVLGGLALAVLPAASAQATPLINTDACDNATLTQPFQQFGDPSYYKLVPGGDFEGSLSGWTLSGAKRMSGSEPFGATGTVGGSSLYVPAGASVQSPYTCVDAAYPTFRFFGRNNGLLSIVAVSIVYKEPLLGTTTLPVGLFALSGSWAPSAGMTTLSLPQGILDAVLTGQTPQVALRFTSVTGSSQIDDVFIDPHMMR